MYGMIHRGMREMVLEIAGADTWTAIETECGIGPSELISASVYDDAITYAVVGATAKAIGTDVEALLRDFGRFWIRFAERGTYGAIMDFTGQDFVSFIANLDRMHQAVNAALPNARTPSFSVVASDGKVIRVLYCSEREGLEPFVTGLLEGLLHRFGEIGTVSPLTSSTNGAEFLITLD